MQTVTLTVSDAVASAEISYDFSSGLINIVDSTTTQYTSNAYFTISNKEHSEVLSSTPLQFEKFNCDSTAFTNMPTSLAETLVVSGSPPAADWVWDTMTFADSLCLVDNYKVTCTAPDGSTEQILAGTQASFTTFPCDIFAVDTSLGVRSISIPDYSLVLNQYEGDYVFTAEGWNSLSPTNLGVYTLTVTINPNCNVATITPPVFNFSNSFGSGDFIGINVFESGTWSLSEFVLSTTTVCEMEFDLLHSADGTAAALSDVALPTYISMTPPSGTTVQPLSISIDGAVTTNEHFTGEGAINKFAVRATVVGSNPPVTSLTEFNVIFFPDCTDS